jgi:hypothetical protein
MIRTLTMMVAMAALAAPVLADEVWSLPSGNRVVYERDSGDTAVFSYTAEQGLAPGLLFIVGLAGNSEARSNYQAYWTENDDAGSTCPASLVDIEGKTWKRWGVAEVKFAKPNFPSKITIRRSECLGPLGKKIVAKPVVGAGLQ